jgi:hypothetical protein
LLSDLLISLLSSIALAGITLKSISKQSTWRGENFFPLRAVSLSLYKCHVTLSTAQLDTFFSRCRYQGLAKVFHFLLSLLPTHTHTIFCDYVIHINTFGKERAKAVRREFFIAID